MSLASRHAVLQFHGHRSIWCNLGRSSSFPPEKTSTLLSIMKILLEEDGRRPETKKPGSTRNCSFDLLSVPHVVHRFVCRISIAILEQIGSTFQDPPGQAVWRPDHRWFLDTRLVETPVESGAGTSDPATSCRLRPSLPILVGASSCSVPAANLVGRKRRKRRRTKNTTDLKRFFNSNGGGDQSVYSQ